MGGGNGLKIAVSFPRYECQSTVSEGTSDECVRHPKPLFRYAVFKGI